MPDVIALGEILIDFTPSGFSGSGNPVFERNPGGAPANVLALLSKLGVSTEFIGKAGDDIFGRELKDILSDSGIGTEGLILSKQYNTTLAFVELDKSGDRSFGFVRNFGADKMLTPADVKLSLLDSSKIFHFGGVSLTDEPSRTATLKTAEEAKKRGLTITYDPNYREPLWKNKNTAIEILRAGLTLSDVVKVSDDECRMLSETEDLNEGARRIARDYGVKLLFITLGAQGSAYFYNGVYKKQPAFRVDTIDTTGAGDAFFGGILYSFIKSGKKTEELTVGDIDRFTMFASAAGALVTTKKGALLSMPTKSEIENFLKENG
ncbi:MAG TPA: carbohydrate kinase [Ruminiclostridium sp.]|nr:carbohydrate kinase [Ruminiclostridium sp.]